MPYWNAKNFRFTQWKIIASQVIYEGGGEREREREGVQVSLIAICQLSSMGK